MLDFYPHMTGLLKRNIRDGHTMESLAIRRCAVAIYSSDWAAKSAIHDYGADPSRVHVVPFGANLTIVKSRAEVADLIDRRPTDSCSLVFIGVDWRRKGGEDALRVAQRLNERGMRTTLTIVGTKPPADLTLPSYVCVAGFINKGSAQGSDSIADCLGRSHFLILPSKADATPVVFGESNAFGVPVLTTRVGGITSIVRDGVNGQTFSSAHFDADAWCDYILSLFSRGGYAELAMSSRREYEERLNWDVAGENVRNLLASAI